MISLRGNFVHIAVGLSLMTQVDSAPLAEDARKVIDSKLALELVMSNARMALELCRGAEQIAAKYDRDPFYDGMIAKCLGYAEMHLKNKDTACAHFDRALMQLEEAGADHPRRSETTKWLRWIREDRAKLGC